MIMNRILTLATLVSVLAPVLASAADLNIKSGDLKVAHRPGDDWMSADANEKMPFTLQKSGSVMVLTDNENKLTYKVDLANTGEQSINPEYLNYLKRRAGTRVFGQMIKDITVTGIRQARPDAVDADINVKVGTQSIFGSVGATIQITARMKTVSCVVHSSRDYNVSVKTTCLYVETGRALNVTKMDTTPSQYNTILGLVSDFVLKLFSPLFSQEFLLFPRV